MGYVLRRERSRAGIRSHCVFGPTLFSHASDLDEQLEGADMIILSTAHNFFWYCCLTGAFTTKLLPKTSAAVTVFADWPQSTEKMWARPAGSDAQKLRPDASADHHSTTIRVWTCVQIYMLRSKLCGLAEKLPIMLCAGLVRKYGPLTMLWQHRWK